MHRTQALKEKQTKADQGSAG